MPISEDLAALGVDSMVAKRRSSSSSIKRGNSLFLMGKAVGGHAGQQVGRGGQWRHPAAGVNVRQLVPLDTLCKVTCPIGSWGVTRHGTICKRPGSDKGPSDIHIRPSTRVRRVVRAVAYAAGVLRLRVDSALTGSLRSPVSSKRTLYAWSTAHGS
jgi:hypothetical protein